MGTESRYRMNNLVTQLVGELVFPLSAVAKGGCKAESGDNLHSHRELQSI